MVERGQAADHRQHRVGMAEVVTRHAGQVLDLSDDVVPEVADEPAVQRWQIGHPGRPVGGEHSLDRAEHALVARHFGSELARHLDVAISCDERRRRPPADEREPAPALGVLDRLEHEARAVADELGEGGDRRLEVGEQLGPDRDDGVVAREPVELGAVGTDVHPNER